jgi:hypothetical protein
MSGEDRTERGTPPDGMRGRAAKAEPRPEAAPPPLPDAAAPASAPAAKVRTPKPPPGIITAGGVDMARGHAANIQPRAQSAALTPAVPRVVLSVETDPRRVPTAPRLIPGGKTERERPAATAGAAASPWGAAPIEVLDKRDLPSANLPVAVPPVAPVKRKSGGWLRYAVMLMLLLVAAGVVRRVRGMGGADATDAPQRTIAVAPPLPPEATADPTATANARPRNLPAPAPSGADPTAPSADPSADPSTEASAEAPPEASVVAPRPRLAPPPPKPTFKPLFELPQEKAKETP